MNIAAALMPVLLFLLLLQLMDSFKLVRPTTVAVAVGAGMVAAAVCLASHDSTIAVMGVSARVFTRYVAPVTEEVAKGAFIAVLLWRSRIGFLVDAAVQGFAVGAGFALAENIDYLRQLPEAGLGLWLVRGLGTGILHGATTAIFAIVSKALADRGGDLQLRTLLPGLALAIAIHSAFNHLLLPPLAMTAVLLLVLPLVVLLVFQRSEAAMRDWVGGGLDLDLELLALVNSEHFAFTRFGEYLRQLRDRFSGPTVADMFCLLRLELELSIQAKGMLLAREAGLVLAPDADLQISLRELGYLQQSIGRTGLLALKPLQVTSGRDRWLRYLLEGRAPRSRGPLPPTC